MKWAGQILAALLELCLLGLFACFLLLLVNLTIGVLDHKYATDVSLEYHASIWGDAKLCEVCIHRKYNIGL